MQNARLDETQAGIKVVGRNINNFRRHHPYGRKWWGTKEPLDENERGEWKSWLKTQHSRKKDHGIQSHHFMVNRWGNSGNSDRLYFLGSKITADGDCSHEIKRCLVLGRKAMTNLDSIWKSRDIVLPTKVHPTLCNPIDGSPPCSPIPGILQARILEWVAISFSNAREWKLKVKSF